MKTVVSTSKFLFLLACLAVVGCAGNLLDENEILYTAVGASDAVGVGATPLTNGYVYLIREELESRGKEVGLINLGIPAANTDLIEDTVQVFLRTGAQPDLVTIWVGANDIVDGVQVDDFEDELEEMLSALRDETSAFIAIANIPDLTELPRFEAGPDDDVTLERVNAFNAVIARQANSFDVPVVDLFEEDIKDYLISDVDGFHPNDAGHRRIAGKFLEVIVPQLD
ncbi:MAG: SGNH/GDSL hydrolase family protein [Nitrococcus sp.]|nr:SGNH/GDSL hydrolase family protein [Nitrococcus sp.]